MYWHQEVVFFIWMFLSIVFLCYVFLCLSKFYHVTFACSVCVNLFVQASALVPDDWCTCTEASVWVFVLYDEQYIWCQQQTNHANYPSWQYVPLHSNGDVCVSFSLSSSSMFFALPPHIVDQMNTTSTRVALFSLSLCVLVVALMLLFFCHYSSLPDCWWWRSSFNILVFMFVRFLFLCDSCCNDNPPRCICVCVYMYVSERHWNVSNVDACTFISVYVMWCYHRYIPERALVHLTLDVLLTCASSCIYFYVTHWRHYTGDWTILLLHIQYWSDVERYEYEMQNWHDLIILSFE